MWPIIEFNIQTPVFLCFSTLTSSEVCFRPDAHLQQRCCLSVGMETSRLVWTRLSEAGMEITAIFASLSSRGSNHVSIWACLKSVFLPQPFHLSHTEIHPINVYFKDEEKDFTVTELCRKLLHLFMLFLQQVTIKLKISDMIRVSAIKVWEKSLSFKSAQSKNVQIGGTM